MGMARALAAMGWESHVYARGIESGAKDLPGAAPGVTLHRRSPAGLLAGLTSRAFGFEGLVRSCVARSGKVIVHDNGVWLPANRQIVRAARRTGTPLVISPRGMLLKGALAIRQVKKRLAWLLYQRRDLAAAAMLHATSDSEAQELRELGARPPIAVVPNAVDAPANLKRPDREESSPRTLLFLSRLDPKKGLPLLVSAWSRVRPAGWRVVIAGPDSRGHEKVIRKLVEESGVAGDFQFPGPISDGAKWSLLAAADLVVLPTRSENFGLVVVEALAAGTPVITTKGAPWAELRSHGCGWWIDLDETALVEALREATSINDVRRREMGERGRRLVRERYTWRAAAGQMNDAYEWLMTGGERPRHVMAATEEKA